MSHDVELINPDGSMVFVKPHQEGGTYVLGGSPEAELNVTYNYGALYHEHLDSKGLDWLNGKTAKDTIARLQLAVKILGTERDPDYWKATAGNAGHALSILLKWAQDNPEAIWRVT